MEQYKNFKEIIIHEIWVKHDVSALIWSIIFHTHIMNINH